MLAKNILFIVATAMPMANALRSQTGKNNPGVYGWCDFTWANANKVQNVQCGARDQSADSHSVFAEVRPPIHHMRTALDPESTL